MQMSLIISSKIRRKLATKHNVAEDEIYQCFASRTGDFLEDTREDHKSDPPTLWFVGETDYGRKLKVVFIYVDKQVTIKTAYLANETEIAIYKKHSKNS